MDASYKLGWIEVVTGPMFAGKSEELLRRIKRLEYAKQKFLVFRPRLDNRYSLDELVSHNKNRYKSILIDQASDILKYIRDDINAVIVDEIQFLDEKIVKISEQLASKGL
ncbi:MAG: thymidine kinase, partial [Erysipelotrichia bacterium]|nr:thymidine kinase [Erysipelotrichia bacterium]